MKEPDEEIGLIPRDSVNGRKCSDVVKDVSGAVETDPKGLP